MDKVLVTGATGFIGLHCVKQLLDGGYAVRGTLRSMKRRDEVFDAMKKSGTKTDNLELVEADLLSDKGWNKAAKGCVYVLHVASPFTTTVPKDENELIKPALEGTLRVLKASQKAGVKKVVLTSSVAAVADTFDGKTHFTEADWSDVESAKIAPYNKSKTLAERAAWDFMSKQGKSAMKLTVINPAGVVGPMLSDDIGTSNAFLKRLIDGSMSSGSARLHVGFVDVRDVATAHVAAMTNAESDGERFIVNERDLWMSDIAKILKDAGFEKAPTRVLPNFLVRLASYFDRSLGVLVTMLGKERHASSDKARKVLGWKPRNVEKSLVETAEQLRSMGLESS